jgi:hypothetical protein
MCNTEIRCKLLNNINIILFVVLTIWHLAYNYAPYAWGCAIKPLRIRQYRGRGYARLAS